MFDLHLPMSYFVANY